MKTILTITCDTQCIATCRFCDVYFSELCTTKHGVYVLDETENPGQYKCQDCEPGSIAIKRSNKCYSKYAIIKQIKLDRLRYT